MTREEAIKVLLEEWKCIDRNDGINCDRKCESCDLVMDSFVLKDAYNTAIKALEQEPCEDAISRKAVLKVIDGWYEQNRDTENIEDLLILIVYMSSVQPSRKGHWIKENPFSLSVCSECGNNAFGYHGFDETRTDFCPHCGADMRERRE